MNTVEYFNELGWKNAASSLGNESSKSLSVFLTEERKRTIVNPAPSLVFNSLFGLKPSDIKVVILGQDPYPEAGVANGLAFGTFMNKQPQTLRNIFREIEADLHVNMDHSGYDLLGWKEQGVLLLNTCLTTRIGEIDSHRNKGWENITSAMLSDVVDGHPKVFMMWGNAAKKCITMNMRMNHKVLEAGHPSPLSVRYFYGCRHFSQANEFLKQPIDWTKTSVERNVLDVIESWPAKN